MVHGAFCGGWVFDRFRGAFEDEGWRVRCPDLPGRRPGESAAGWSMTDFTRSVVEICRAEAEPPVLIGHSLGGLVAQLAASRAKVRALILLAPSPPWGVAGATLEEGLSAVALYALGPFWSLPITPNYPSARRWLFDRLPAAERRAAFARLAPESGLALWQTLNWWLDPLASTYVDPARIDAPVLALVGDGDIIHPPKTVRETAGRLGGETRVFPNMSHWLPQEPGWREVAEASLSWLANAAA